MTAAEGREPAVEARDGLVVEDLSVSLNTPQGVITPVQRATLSVAPGEKVAVVGETGCGKSVLLKSLLRLLPPKVLHSLTGSVRVGDAELVGATERVLNRARREDVGVVFQDASSYLNPTMPIGEQVAEVVPGRGNTRAKVQEVFRSVGLPNTPEYLGRYPHELSGGMRQRVMIAVALAREPRILLADEPTTALDVTVQAGILERLDQLVQSTGLGLLIVTHDLGVVAELCDRVYVMYAGQIVESGAVADVFGAPEHPYTSRLMACVLDVDEPGELRSIPGSVPSPFAFPTGCRFRDRCEQAMDVCGEEPGLVAESGRQVRCWLHTDVEVLRT